jgi:hypothetical protein
MRGLYLAGVALKQLHPDSGLEAVMWRLIRSAWHLDF